MVGMPKYLSEDVSEKFLSKPECFVLPVLTCEETVNIGQQQDQRDLAIWVFFQVFGQEHEIELMPRWLFWRTGLGKDGRKERNHFLWNTICSESSKPTRLSTYQLVSFNLCYLSPLIGEWKYFHRVSSTIMSSSTHNNILGVTLSGDFGDVCTLSDLRPNRSWAIPHNCLIIVSAHNIDRAEAAAAIPSLAMSWPSLQFGSIRGQHLQAVSYVLS